ncbi:hypothetical protein [Clostridium sp. D43t1_170807_H7]|uniref:hypothetical protein n=1 Tax=Clostridium sp. D43t1_170807_H7 TaxID=2787140 RepID=UPI001898F9C1|nr:hypothetical protein [Clostridium sp. D43t1_170807_H7]
MKLYGDININQLQLLGKGTQGKVYKIDEEKCIKVFKRKNYCENEVFTLIISQNDSHFPKLYSYGDNYIIRELIKGIDLDKYLLNNSLTPALSNKILELYDAMYRVGFSRLDTALFHIFITDNEDIKLIDTARAMSKNVVYPTLIINALNDLGYKNQFLSYVKIVRPDILKKWRNNLSKEK